MNTPQTMTELMARIETAVQRVVTAVSQLSAEQMTVPNLDDGRSVKDILAHLTWWDHWLLFTLPADPRSPHKAVAPPLMDQIPSGTTWADEMNGRVYSYNQTRELSAILAEFTTGYQHLLQRVALLSFADLYDPEGMSATIGYPVAPLILGIYEHYEEHADELEGIS
ncbi:MAG: ClbS/DfsB family four-helix bundle protein [Anaerolineales bacterium]|nr:ClbS/DfsB family four-helix bundle protein [Anaerolineales bacterium]